MNMPTQGPLTHEEIEELDRFLMDAEGLEDAIHQKNSIVSCCRVAPHYDRLVPGT
jgi:hypothetical protein